MGIDHLLIIILVGLVAGFFATHLVAGHGFGLVGDILVGILGALLATLLLGGWIATYILGPLGIPDGSVLGQVVIAFIGSVILVAILRLVAGARSGGFSRRRLL
jgi:uncharacterized membrane protein YeaQ/YmgE (transglycosylase-associated protein family)